MEDVDVDGAECRSVRRDGWLKMSGARVREGSSGCMRRRGNAPSEVSEALGRERLEYGGAGRSRLYGSAEAEARWSRGRPRCVGGDLPGIPGPSS